MSHTKQAFFQITQPQELSENEVLNHIYDIKEVTSLLYISVIETQKVCEENTRFFIQLAMKRTVL